MLTKNLLIGLVSLVAVAEASAIHRPFDHIMSRRAVRSLQGLQPRQFGKGNKGGNQGGNQGNNQAQNSGGNNNNGGNAAAASLTLDSNALQTGSASNGNPNTTAGESASKTDNANFINFCSGLILTNGLQQQGGSCNGIPMGNIPSTENMVSSVLVNPQNNDNVAANQDFDIQVQVANFAPGTFTNAENTYYSAPQDLNAQGQIIGHTHVSVQDTGNDLNPTQPLDAKQFAFFKGINDAGNGKGLLSATVTGGLPAGNYRVCTMTSSANHQPVLMPVAQRGPQDDCVRFTVGGAAANNGQNNGGNGGNNSGNNSNNGNNNNANSASQAKATSGSLGGALPQVTDSGDSDRPFSVAGNTFTSKQTADLRACDIQNNACFNAANAGGASFSTSDCTSQQQACQAAA